MILATNYTLLQSAYHCIKPNARKLSTPNAKFCYKTQNFDAKRIILLKAQNFDTKSKTSSRNVNLFAR